MAYGDDLTSHAEQILVDLCGGRPLFLTYYPRDPKPRTGGVIKFFSMERTSRNGEHVTRCCDLLLPGVGETVGGAVRVGDPKVIRQQFQESLMREHIAQRGIDADEEFNWYFEAVLDDNTQSAGCGIGLERLIQFMVHERSIKNCVEFPRSPDFINP